MTPKQEVFAREYLIDLNATQAAIRAGYSPRSAEVQGARLLSNAKVRTLIASGMEARTEQLGRSAQEVIRRLWLIVEADARRAFNDDGPIPPSKLPHDIAAVLATVKIGDSVEYKLNDRLKALELLGKHYGMFTERTEIKTTAQVVIYLPDNGRQGVISGQADQK